MLKGSQSGRRRPRSVGRRCARIRRGSGASSPRRAKLTAAVHRAALRVPRDGLPSCAARSCVRERADLTSRCQGLVQALSLMLDTPELSPWLRCAAPSDRAHDLDGPRTRCPSTCSNRRQPIARSSRASLAAAPNSAPPRRLQMLIRQTLLGPHLARSRTLAHMLTSAGMALRAQASRPATMVPRA